MKQRSIEKIDQNKYDKEAASAAQVVLQLGGLAMRFSRVERTPRYTDSRRESDVEHSFMLSLVATELAHSLYPHLDKGRIAEFASVHDLPEIVTQDVATFNISQEALHTKEQAEKIALPHVYTQLTPYIRHLLEEYESQKTCESRFVRAVDKLLPVAVDIYGDGLRVMEEDYDIHSIDDLHRCHGEVRERIAARFGEFPELILAYELLSRLFQADFIAATQLEQTPASLH